MELERLVRAHKTEANLKQRANLILKISEGKSLYNAKDIVGISYQNANKWVHRFKKLGISGLKDSPRSGRPPIYGDKEKKEIIKVITSRPSDLGLPFTTWSLPKTRNYLQDKNILPNISWDTIRRVIKDAGFKYRMSRTWCYSNDPLFEVKKTK